MLRGRISSEPARRILQEFCDTETTEQAAGDVLSQIEPGTNSWIHSHDEITQWLSGHGTQSLSLFGQHGSGRTHVAGSIVQKLVQQASARQAVCYFFCDSTPAGSSVSHLLKTVLVQLALQSQAAYDELKPALERVQDTRDSFDQADDNGQLRSLLIAAARHFDAVFLVLNRADYQPPSVFALLSSIIDELQAVRMFVTMLDGPGQREVCRQAGATPIQIPDCTDDIRLYIGNELQRRNAQTAAPVIEDYIANNASSWLSAVYMLEEQCDLLRRGSWQPPTAGSFSLESVLDSYLTRVMQDSDPKPKFLLCTVSKWLATAWQCPRLQLSSSELCLCLSSLLRDQNAAAEAIQEHQVMEACGPLICRLGQGPSARLHLRHSSTYHYLYATLASYDEPLSEVCYTGYSKDKVIKQLRVASQALESDHTSVSEKIYLALLAIAEEAWGPDDADTLITVEFLGSLYSDQGRVSDAEGMYRRAIEGYTRNPPADREPQSNVYNLQAVLYKRQGRFAEAEEMYKLALHLKEELFGRQHAKTVAVLNNMGMMYAASDKPETARDLWEECLTFSDAHPDAGINAATLAYDLGLANKIIGDFDKAEPLLERAHRMYVTRLGPNADTTLDAAHVLGHIYILRHRYDDAERVYLALLAAHERTDPLSKDTLETCHSLAKVYQAQQRPDEAEAMCRRALSGYEQTLGPDDVATVDVAYTLFLLLEDQNRPEAVDLGERVLAAFSRIHGSSAKVANATAYGLGFMYARMGRLDRAEEMWMRAYLGFMEKEPGEPRTMAAAHNLGLLYQMQGREETKEWLLRAMAGFERIEGPDGPNVARIAHDLANLT